MTQDTPGHPPPPSGLLLVDKTRGPTSMDCCRAVKHRLINAGFHKSIKVGHGGTLDPLATGLVVVLVGKATKLCDAVMAGEKEYLADVDLSVTSPTQDLEGDLTRIDVASPPSREDVERAILPFIGLIQQRPPAHSAMWVNGERAYDLARQGKAPDLPARPVQIHAITLTEYAWPIARLDITCGKGTYIRSLARDLGEALGVGGCLASLRRTRSGRFRVEEATPYDRLPHQITPADLRPLPKPGDL
ncbi:MAG: tRNA pseudouridine(55) synthase TruB [Phycisphaeraceae bacterium]|nr:tRNA pseudouridine(55) synthase TruB [Phycisphaeraceae bacterium]